MQWEDVAHVEFSCIIAQIDNTNKIAVWPVQDSTLQTGEEPEYKMKNTI